MLRGLFLGIWIWMSIFHSERSLKSSTFHWYSTQFRTPSQSNGCWLLTSNSSHMKILKGHLRNYFGTVHAHPRSGVEWTKTAVTVGWEKVFRSITSSTQTWLVCSHPPCPTMTYGALISANIKSVQEVLVVLTKLHSLENSREQYRTTQQDFEHQDLTRRTSRGQTVDSPVNRRPTSSVQVHQVRRDSRDRNYRGNLSRDTRTNESQRSYFCSQGRPNDGADPLLNASTHDFMPCSSLWRNDNRSHDGVRTGDKNA
jgi:deoxycytidylate deaminase